MDWEFGSSDNLTVKQWRKGFSQETLTATFFNKYASKGADTPFQIIDDLEKDAGDTVTCGLSMLIDGAGIAGEDIQSGKEVDINYYDFSISIDQLSQAVRKKGDMSQQRIREKFRGEAKAKLKKWWAERMDVSVFNQLCCYTPQTDTRYTGMNAVTEADDAHRIFSEDGTTVDEDLDSNDLMTVEVIDACLERAKMMKETYGYPVLQPIMIGGKAHYIMFIHPFQETDLWQQTTGKSLQEQMLAAMAGGMYKNNPLVTGALGIYRSVILHSTERITSGVDSVAGTEIATVKRAVFCGAQSLAVAFGKKSRGTRVNWAEEKANYGRKHGIAADSVLGMKATRYNNALYGHLVVSTYAAAH